MHNPLPTGVRYVPLETHRDQRGRLTELHRQTWTGGLDFVQWNAVFSVPGTLRGVHAHVRHWDYLTFVEGRAQVALLDLRRGSPTEGLATFQSMNGAAPAGIVIPPGVAHAFLTIEASVHVYAVTHYWDPDDDVDDELGCDWADPELGLAWPIERPLLSPRDTDAPSLREMRRRLEPWQPFHGTFGTG